MLLSVCVYKDIKSMLGMAILLLGLVNLLLNFQ